MKDLSPETRTRALAILIALVTLLLAVTFVASQEMARIQAWISRSGWTGLLVTVLIYALLGATPVPSEPLTVLASAIFGPFYATLVASLGNLLSALIEYYIGRQIADAAAFERRREQLPFGLGKFPVNSLVFLIGARNLTGYGAKFVSLVAGIYRVPLWRYTWTTIVASLPGTALLAYGGWELLNFLFNR